MLSQSFLVIGQRYVLIADLNMVSHAFGSRRTNVEQYRHVLIHIYIVQFPTFMTIGRDIRISRESIILRTWSFIYPYICCKPAYFFD